MVLWLSSDVTHSRLGGLVAKGLLCPLTNAVEWIAPRGDRAPSPPYGYIVSFMHFHELLHHYWIELQHLNPNGIQQISAFITLCDGYLWIPPHFELWKYFFSVQLQKSKVDGIWVIPPIGYIGIHLHQIRVDQYMDIHLKKYHKLCHRSWFYIRNCDHAHLSDITGQPMPGNPCVW